MNISGHKNAGFAATGRGKKGFTAIEAVITIILVSVIGFIAAQAFMTGVRAYLVTDQRKEALDQSRVAIDRMTREFRHVRAVADADADGYADAEIGTATATAFCFRNVFGTRMDFVFAGGNLTLLEDGAACGDPGGNVLATDLSAFSFNYVLYDGTATPAPADRTDIRKVRIDLTATVNNESVPLRSEAFLRNLIYNTP